MRVRFDKLLSAAGELEVVVQSWDSTHQTMTQEIARAASTPMSNSNAPKSKKRFLIMQPNLSSELAASLANMRLGEMSGPQTTVEIEMPGEVALEVRDEIYLTGHTNSLAGPYEIEMIDRRFNRTSGFSQRLTARCINK